MLCSYVLQKLFVNVEIASIFITLVNYCWMHVLQKLMLFLLQKIFITLVNYCLVYVLQNTDYDLDNLAMCLYI